MFLTKNIHQTQVGLIKCPAAYKHSIWCTLPIFVNVEICINMTDSFGVCLTCNLFSIKNLAAVLNVNQITCLKKKTVMHETNLV